MKWAIQTFLVFITLCFSAVSFAQEKKLEKHIEVSMRMIGDQTLHLAGDSTSRVLPIQKENTTYRIQFENDFQLAPSEVISTINNVVQKTRIANSYLVEVEDCNTQEIVYSYEIGSAKEFDVIPCQSRTYPKSCYSLLITILDTYNPVVAVIENHDNIPYDSSSIKTQESSFPFLLPSLLFALIAGVLAYFWNARKKSHTQSNIIRIGKYEFDPKNMELIFQNNKTELTSKESDLLNLLYTSANNTVEREVLLKEVWGDDGDYVGRTLDVFISKLRKKIEGDKNLKIVNIRGIGYKFILND